MLQQAGLAEVIGDRTAGRVQASFYRPLIEGTRQNFITYGLQVTVGDLEMWDGVRLEARGVYPDREMLPDWKDVGSRRDPVLATVLGMVGISVTPFMAARLYEGRLLDP